MLKYRTMTVKELIEALQQCDPEAEVFTEGWQSNTVLAVAEYTHKETGTKAVRVGDCFDYVDDEILETRNKKVIIDLNEKD